MQTFTGALAAVTEPDAVLLLNCAAVRTVAFCAGSPFLIFHDDEP